jgi:hypothetical protein
MKRYLITLTILVAAASLMAQNYDTIPVIKKGDSLFVVLEHKNMKTVHRDGENQFAILGNAAVTFQAAKYDPAGSDVIHFTELNFKPIFLWKISKRLFIEAEVEIETGGGAPDIGLEYANMVYIVNPYLTLHAGRFLPKFGAYRGRFGEDFLNRFARNPVGFGDGGIGAMNETGIGAQGGFQVGPSKINYDLYVSNGPQLATGKGQFEGDDPSGAGQYNYEAYIGNNNSKAVGGRFGFVPFSNSCLEIAYSFQYAAHTGSKGAIVSYNEYVDSVTANTGTINYEKVSLQMHDVDINFFHTLPLIKSTIRLTGEYKYQKGGNATYITEADSAGYAYRYSYNNVSHAYYITASLRPSQVANNVLRNFEIAARFSQFFRPKGAVWAGAEYEGGVLATPATNLMKIEASLDYWLKWNCLAKLTYEYVKGDNTLYRPHAFYAQLVFGF